MRHGTEYHRGGAHVIDDRLRLAIIIGSVRRGRFGPVAAQWLAAEAGRRGDFEVDVIDLAEARLPEVPPGDGVPTPQAVQDLAPWLAAAEAFVVVTPEYNRSFPASLKNAIDWYRREWQAKPVGFVSYGGPAGGLRAVEQLRLVFAELDAMTVRESVDLREHRSCFDKNGRPRDAENCNAAAKSMLDQLLWWAQALRNHRALHPYGS